MIIFMKYIILLFDEEKKCIMYACLYLCVIWMPDVCVNKVCLKC
jgi:hypothetical protein